MTGPTYTDFAFDVANAFDPPRKKGQRVRVIYVDETNCRARVIEYSNREARTPRASSRQLYCSPRELDEFVRSDTIARMAWDMPLPERMTDAVWDFISHADNCIWAGERPEATEDGE